MNEIALKFVAHQLMMLNDQRMGYTHTPHWLCTREDIQQRFLKEAHLIVYGWWANEQAQQKAREEGEKEVFGCIE